MGKPTGKLRIGDDWNAITIIALSQSNPLKAVAEFVENSIDAGARNVSITRGRQNGKHYLRISDDGEGIPRNREGIPNFQYVATHICDSIKRKLKIRGAEGIQGEFGIGLLSFWTVGEELHLTSSGSDGRMYRMLMKKGDPNYSVNRTRKLFATPGTELLISPLLTGIRQFSGEKIQWYLSSELRDRIRRSQVQIRIVDRTARKEYRVRPRKFEGRRIQLRGSLLTEEDLRVELYLTEPTSSGGVGLYRMRTRVLARITDLESLNRDPWTHDRLEGLIDAPFLNLTPGTRTGIIRDQYFSMFLKALEPVEEYLRLILEEQEKAEEERASKEMLKTIRKAFREALLALPPEEYDWFSIQARAADGRAAKLGSVTGFPEVQRQEADADGSSPLESQEEEPGQKRFFEYAGPLYRVAVSPTLSVVAVDTERNLRALARDRSNRIVEEDLIFHWEILEGEGSLDNSDGEICSFQAPEEPGLTRVKVTVFQHPTECSAEALLTVADSLPSPDRETVTPKMGMPGYTFERAPGELWRSRFDEERNLIVINSGHHDFVYASATKALKLRYIVRLFSKELVLRNFPGYSPEQLLERLVELSLYTERNLK